MESVVYFKAIIACIIFGFSGWFIYLLYRERTVSKLRIVGILIFTGIALIVNYKWVLLFVIAILSSYFLPARRVALFLALVTNQIDGYCNLLKQERGREILHNSENTNNQEPDDIREEPKQIEENEKLRTLLTQEKAKTRKVVEVGKILYRASGSILNHIPETTNPIEYQAVNRLEKALTDTGPIFGKNKR